MPLSSEKGSFFKEHGAAIGWSLMGILVGAVGWEAVRTYLDKSTSHTAHHPYDGLSSRERFEVLMAKREEIPHY